jgi:pyridoxal phosphate enzyme (YggS family)
VVNAIAERLAQVRIEIRQAAVNCGRPPDSVRLVAVSKTKTPEEIRAVYDAGQRDFGENYVQELASKAEALADLHDLRFHFIGHLQRNKAKVAARIASAIHSIDSVRLAEEVGKRAAEAPVTRSPASFASASSDQLAVFVEVNVGGEAQKTGCPPSELGAVLGAIESAPALQLVGLMTVPPLTDDPEGARPYFDALAALRNEHGGAERLPELSMGMSHDLAQAIAAGATIVRVGRAIFGERA